MENLNVKPNATTLEAPPRRGVLRRAVATPLARVIVAAGVFLVLQVIVGNLAGTLPAALQGPLLTQTLALAVAVATFAFVTRVVERRPFAAAGLTRSGLLTGTAAGFVVGAILVAAAVGGLAAAGAYEASVAAPGAFLAHGLLLFLLVGVGEELLFRGLLFRILEEGLGTWLALATVAVAFGALHLVNENATAWGALGTGLAGVLLGAAFVLTRDLWLAIGIHWSWNFSLGTIFGAPVSGRDAGPSLLEPTLRGPEAWTGGAFGPEAGLAGFLVAAVGSVVLLALAVRRSRIVTPRSMRRAR